MAIKTEAQVDKIKREASDDAIQARIDSSAQQAQNDAAEKFASQLELMMQPKEEELSMKNAELQELGQQC